jgi:predicted transcriptional regulator YdeE
MQPKIVNREAFTVMGVVGHFQSAGENFGPLWQEYMAVHDKIEPLSASEGHYGIYLGADHCGPIDYLAGMAVRDTADPLEGVETREVPGATFAVFECSFQELGPTYGYIWDEWLQSPGYVQDTSKMGFDYFPPGTADGDSPMEIWFPVGEKEGRET